MKWTKIIKKIEDQVEAGSYPGASFEYFKDNQWTE
ncbi:serine hydrolase, partial [Streptococcus pneumoniae]